MGNQPRGVVWYHKGATGNWEMRIEMDSSYIESWDYCIVIDCSKSGNRWLVFIEVTIRSIMFGHRNRLLLIETPVSNKQDR